MGQKRYDEAEVAWKHALKINRFYTVAHNNLRTLASARKGEDVIMGRYVEVYENGRSRMQLVVDEERKE